MQFKTDCGLLFKPRNWRLLYRHRTCLIHENTNWLTIHFSRAKIGKWNSSSFLTSGVIENLLVNKKNGLKIRLDVSIDHFWRFVPSHFYKFVTWQKIYTSIYSAFCITLSPDFVKFPDKMSGLSAPVYVCLFVDMGEDG